MQKYVVMLFMLMLVFAGCIEAPPEGTPLPTAPPATVVVPSPWVATNTPLPTVDPTPTQEIWAGWCLPEGVVPVHQGACLEQNPHGDIELVTRGNDNWPNKPDLTFDSNTNAYICDWNDAAGFCGLRIHGVELAYGQCYVIHLKGYSELTGLPYWNAIYNYEAQGRILRSNSTVYTLNTHNLKAKDADTLTGDRDFFWGLWTANPLGQTVVVEIGINELWSVAIDGSHFRITAAWVAESNNASDCAVPGV